MCMPCPQHTVKLQQIESPALVSITAHGCQELGWWESLRIGGEHITTVEQVWLSDRGDCPRHGWESPEGGVEQIALLFRAERAFHAGNRQRRQWISPEREKSPEITRSMTGTTFTQSHSRRCSPAGHGEDGHVCTHASGRGASDWRMQRWLCSNPSTPSVLTGNE